MRWQWLKSSGVRRWSLAWNPQPPSGRSPKPLGHFRGPRLKGGWRDLPAMTAKMDQLIHLDWQSNWGATNLDNGLVF